MTRRTRPASNRVQLAQVTIRWSTAGDRAELATVAALDGTAAPAGPVLVAVVAGRLVAYVTDRGRVVADPFVPTADAGELLLARRAQVTDGWRSRREARRLRPLIDTR